jgi:hypothetical protein
MPSPYGDLGSVIPSLSSLNKTASSDILSKLGGTLSPGTLNALQNASATYGATSGMPGSGLSWNSLYGNIAGASEAQQQQGLQDYSSFIPTVSGAETVSPSLQATISGTNASNAAAPNPGQSASYAAQMFQNYLDQMRGPQSGFGGFGNPAFDSTTQATDPYSVYSVGQFPYQPDFAAGGDTSAYATA